MTAFEKLTIDTPEQIALEFTLAGVGSRFLALAVDTAIQATVFLVLAYLVIAVSAFVWPSDSMWGLAIVVLIGFSLLYGYFATFEWLWRGQTPGKRVMGLRVISATGHPMTPYQAGVRNLLRIVDQIPGLYGVGIGAVLLTERSQRLGDLVAGTVVVREEVATRQPLPDIDAAPPRGRDAYRAARLSEAEVALIERFLQRRGDLEWRVRDQTARQIAQRIRQRLDIPPDGPDEALLERVVAEYRSPR